MTAALALLSARVPRCVAECKCVDSQVALGQKLKEELERSAARLGVQHENVLESAEGLKALLEEAGKADEAKAIAKAYKV